MSCIKSCAILLATLVSLGVAGCPAHVNAPAGPTPVADLPFRYAEYDFKLAWKIVPSGQGIALDGLIKNVLYPNVDGLEVTVSLLAPDGRVLARGTDYPIPPQIGYDETRQFFVKLVQGKVVPGERLQFELLYRATDGSVGFWLSRFQVDAITGAGITPPGGPQPGEGW